jgi:hypothetical protein
VVEAARLVEASSAVLAVVGRTLGPLEAAGAASAALSAALGVSEGGTRPGRAGRAGANMLPPRTEAWPEARPLLAAVQAQVAAAGRGGARLSVYALAQHTQYLDALALVLRHPDVLPVRALGLVDLVTLPLGTLAEPAVPGSADADSIAVARLVPDAQYVHCIAALAIRGHPTRCGWRA